MKIPKRYLLLLILSALCAFAYGSSFADNTVAMLQERGLSPVLIVVIISMLPLIELRGAIPVAMLLFKMPWYEAVALSVIGNMIPIPLILLLMDWFFALISKNSHGSRFTQWLFARTRRKGKIIEKYEAIGITVFVGIPLPGTGAWTGAFAANIFGVSFWKSMLYTFLGVLIAGAIMTLLSGMGTMVLG